MRISDWSSDVCSSDEHGFPFEASVEPAADACGRQPRKAADDVTLQAVAVGVAEVPLLRGVDAGQLAVVVGRHTQALGSEVPALPPVDRKRTRMTSSQYCANRMTSSA